MVETLFRTETLHVLTDFKEVQSLVRVRFVKETDVRNLRQGKRRSLRHLNTIKLERLPPTNEQKKPSDLPKPP